MIVLKKLYVIEALVNKEKFGIIMALVLVIVSVFALFGCHNADDEIAAVLDR